MYQPGNNPPPTRPQPVYQPGPSFTPSQPPPVFAPAHQAPRQRNWIAQHKVLSGIGLSVIIGAIAALATSGNSGSSGSLPGGISSSSCTVKWQGYDPYTHTWSPVYAAQARAQSWENAQWAQDQKNGYTAGTPAPITGTPYGPPAPPTQVVTATVTVGSTVDVYSLTVAYYSNSGTEISSESQNVSQILTAGQSVSNSNFTLPSGAASCAVVAWS